MAEIGIRDCRHVPARPSNEDLAFLNEADLILLAGGDVERGWQAFEATGLKEKIVERYYAGAILMGVSAGAVQLGLKGWDEGEVFDTFRLVPFVVDVHDEPNWTRLQRPFPRPASTPAASASQRGRRPLPSRLLRGAGPASPRGDERDRVGLAPGAALPDRRDAGRR